MPWVDANDWAKLAWYATIQIARNPDGERELEKLARAGWNLANTSIGFPLNAQRISSAVVRARWHFIWSPDRDFVLGDRGITGISYPPWKSWAYFVPLRRNFGVVLGPGPYEKQMKWSGGMWHIYIPTFGIANETAGLINATAWHAARSEIYGASAEALVRAREAASSVPPDIQEVAPMCDGAPLLGLDVHARMDDELLLLNMLRGIREPDDKDNEVYLKV
jgi:hypothetical protein